ncbi:hypothetical protein NC651_019177 [Populus alba x Populus x berolinensis]|nr:hypothetical protein NC651_019168 [Populus alba x Populus x berolinensis]KAJ6901328.1 hypothetical protein NC651_019170 [Populus alba x Populus x berolinensis]KAJ6901339.1 hypothetical protein NC651_019177 [Populus alba x Populus x berolinensis]
MFTYKEVSFYILVSPHSSSLISSGSRCCSCFLLAFDCFNLTSLLTTE